MARLNTKNDLVRRKKNYSVVFSALSTVFGNVLKHGLSCLLNYINLSEVSSNLTVLLHILKKYLRYRDAATESQGIPF